jgi:SAM-dependent methyltransferase
MFNKESERKYKKSQITGTGYIAYKDINALTRKYNCNIDKVLDLGCGFGRSTEFLKKISNDVFGSDISEESVKYCQQRLPECKFFINEKKEKYNYAPYTIIYSILMLFHINNKETIFDEMSRMYNSLIDDGFVFIVNGTKNLYTKKYLSVGGFKEPKKSGDKCSIFLKNIDLVVNDYYWDERDLVDIAKKIGFKKHYIYYPLADKSVDIGYIDEYDYPPYFVLILQR